VREDPLTHHDPREVKHGAEDESVPRADAILGHRPSSERKNCENVKRKQRDADTDEVRLHTHERLSENLWEFVFGDCPSEKL
jgi:hypothetical protein